MSSRKRKAFTIADKLHIVDRIKNGETQARVSRDTGVAESTLRGWLKDQVRLRHASSTMDDCGQVRKRARLAKDQQLDDAVLTWFHQARSEGIPISGPVIQSQALKLHKELRGDAVEDIFEASNGWLRRFKLRHSISQVTTRGEKSTSNEYAAVYHPVDDNVRGVDQRVHGNVVSTNEDLQTVIEAFVPDINDDQIQNGVTAEDDTPTYQTKTAEEIVNSVKDTPPTEVDVKESREPPPNYEVVLALENVIRWAETSKRGTATRVMQLRDMLYDARAESRDQTVQTKLTAFFKNDLRGSN